MDDCILGSEKIYIQLFSDLITIKQLLAEMPLS